MVSLSQQNTTILPNSHSIGGGYKDCQTVWQHCLEIIKNEIPEQSFKTWFIPVRPLRLRQNILTIQVPSLYFYEFLEEHYVFVLRKAIIEQLGTQGKLEYSLLPEKQHVPLFDTYTEPTYQNPTKETTNQENFETSSSQASLFQNVAKQNTNQKETDLDNPIVLNGNSNYESATSRSQLANSNLPKQQSIRQEYRNENELESRIEPRNQNRVENKTENRQNVTNTSNQFAQQVQKTSNFQSSAYQSSNSNHYNQTENQTQNQAPNQTRAIQNQSKFRPVKTTQQLPHNLNTRYTFDTFVEGECNNVAFAAGRAIAKNPGRTSFHPLVLYGGVGLGKTHLAHAIGNKILEHYPEKRVVYVSADQFANDYVSSVREQQITQFTEQYYHLDVLIVDDIQFLCDKVKTQESFFHIFNHLHSAGKQIIMTSDCAPAQMRGLQERLLSRFKWGAILDLKVPDVETRKAIIYTKLQGYESQVSLDVIDFLAKSVTTNVRELEGVITSLLAKSSLADMNITLDLARQALGAVVAHQNTIHELSIDAIEEIVAAFFQVTLEQLKGKTRKKEIALARQFAMYLTKEYTDLPLKAIGWHFGKRDHSTVIHACKVVPMKVEQEESYKKTFDEIIKRIEQL